MSNARLPSEPAADSVAAYKTLVLQRVCLVTLAGFAGGGAGFVGLLLLYAGPGIWAGAGGDLLGVLACLLSRWLLRSGHYRPAIWLVQAAILFNICVDFWLFGTSAPIPLCLVIPLMLGALLMEVGEAVGIAVLCGALAAGMYAVQDGFGWFRPNLLFTPIQDTIVALATIAIIFPVGTALLIIPFHSLTRMLQAQNNRLRADNAALHQAEEQQRFLAEAGVALVAPLTDPATLETTARLLVPQYGDLCLIYRTDPGDSPATLRRVAARDPAQAAALEAHVAAQAESEPQADPFLVPLRTGVTLRLALPAEGPLDFLLTPAQTAWLAPLGLATLLAVPLRARGEVRGVLGLARTAPAPPYTPADQVLLEDLARRAALVLDNARLYTEAQQAIQVREDFLSIASHELKTPLTGLRLQMQLLLRQAREGSLPPGTRLIEVLERAERQIKQLNTLINRLLDLALGPAGPPELQLSQVDLAALARRVAEQLNLDLTTAGCPLLLEAAAPLLGRWDEGRVEQVVTNLLGNALKYGRGRPIHLCVRRVGDSACLDVRDEGIGIAPQDQARIFDRFERAVAVRHYGGFGLGLYITRQIVEAHGGTIQVESAPGQGATFHVCLPIAGPPSMAQAGDPPDRSD